MSRARQELKRRKLAQVLSLAEDESFLRMVWAVDALQSGRAVKAACYLNFPTEAANDKIDSPFAIHEWELETLVGLLLSTPKRRLHPERNRYLNCTEFSSAANAVRLLRGLEDAEAGLYIRENSIFLELHRIAQRQFAWQTGYFNLMRVYRYTYIYGHGSFAEYFVKKNGITVDIFSIVGVGFYQLFKEKPSVDRKVSMSVVGVTPQQVETAVRLLSAPITQARREATLLRAKFGARQPVGYQPSTLRRNPIISFGSEAERLLAPLPELIVQRVSSGLFYDAVTGDDSLRNEAGQRFEMYCAKFAAATLPSAKVGESFKYKFVSKQLESPDLFLSWNDKVCIPIECKARRLSVDAQFADNPIEQAHNEYAEIAKGVSQLWKYFSHVRLGAIRHQIDNQAIGMVLTLEPWLLMSHDLAEHVIEEAKRIAARHREIEPCDQRPVVFCSFEEFERTILSTDETMFLATVRAASSEKFRGWALSNVHKEIHEGKVIKQEFPFDLGEVLPWKKYIDGLRKTAATAAT